MPNKQESQRVHFRLIQMPCCGHFFCNVNPRLPNYCPECGQRCFPEVRGCVVFSDEDAFLSTKPYKG